MLKFHKILFLSIGALLFFSPTAVWAYCMEDNYFGITSGNPIMSTVDVTSSFSYSSTSTSGTSGCKNWDFAQYLEESRKKFITRERQQILEEVAQGKGPHLNALGQLMGCRRLDHRQFVQMLKTHHATLATHLTISDHPEHVKAVLKDIKNWIAQHSQLKQSCNILG